MDISISTPWLLTLVWMSVMGGLLTCAIMIIQRIAQPLLSPLCCYCLSALIIVRLLIPGSLVSVHGLLPEMKIIGQQVEAFMERDQARP